MPNVNTSTQLDDIFQPLSLIERWRLKAFAYRYEKDLPPSLLQKFVRLRLLARDGENVVLTLDGRRVVSRC